MQCLFLQTHLSPTDTVLWPAIAFMEWWQGIEIKGILAHCVTLHLVFSMLSADGPLAM